MSANRANNKQSIKIKILRNTTPRHRTCGVAAKRLTASENASANRTTVGRIGDDGFYFQTTLADSHRPPEFKPVEPSESIAITLLRTMHSDQTLLLYRHNPAGTHHLSISVLKNGQTRCHKNTKNNKQTPDCSTEPDLSFPSTRSSQNHE
ncbi:hypothetical protein [Zoogloea sp. LCSB751]|uniref:hypothetical protein n=1 Tax=Zoogloea sp. LCSB751 TaxID=1965277 RepID=UPI001115CA75|nr:hypothetical protein [Zoogloea sp. LCSB751]